MFRLVILCIEPFRLKLLPKNEFSEKELVGNYVRQQVCNFSVLTKSSLSALAKVVKVDSTFLKSNPSKVNPAIFSDP